MGLSFRAEVRVEWYVHQSVRCMQIRDVDGRRDTDMGTKPSNDSDVSGCVASTSTTKGVWPLAASAACNCAELSVRVTTSGMHVTPTFLDLVVSFVTE